MPGPDRNGHVNLVSFPVLSQIKPQAPTCGHSDAAGRRSDYTSSGRAGRGQRPAHVHLASEPSPAGDGPFGGSLAADRPPAVPVCYLTRTR